jgi:hypothetical protein
VVGSRDELVGPEAAKTFSALATSAAVNRTYIVPNCDHQFKGEANGYIMSDLPRWAFCAKGEGAPDGKQGIKLY